MAFNPVTHASTMLNEMEQVTSDCNASLIRLQSIIHARAEQSEATSTALTWIQKVSWGVKDAHEFKARQLRVNLDENILHSIPPFLAFLRSLTSETDQDVTRLMQPEFPTNDVLAISYKFSNITPILYHI